MGRLRLFGSNVRAGFAGVARPRPANARRLIWPARDRLAFGALIALLCVAAAMMLIDSPSLDQVGRLPAPLIVLFEDITDLGLSGWFLFPTAVALLVIAAVDRASAPRFVRSTLGALAVRFGFVFTAVAMPGLFVTVMKRLIGRARPADQGTWTYVGFDLRHEYASMPSGHATTAFSAAVAIGALWPQARPAMWIYAVVIAVSRIIVSAHHPSDVLVGAIVGTIGALLVRRWFAERRLGFAVGTDGLVHRLPGPSWRRLKAVARRLWSA
jgi:undecaprenyl-diphosphatase